jgi:sugar-specific transcriptional regulator TrmB
VDDAPDNLDNESFEKRDEFGREVRERLATVDRELSETERSIGKDASEAQTQAVAAAREARDAAQRSLERLGSATRENWNALRDEIDDAVDAAEVRVRELRPDVKPMGGTGGPS